ncbi:hypothetical protein [Parafrankia sp. EUN1f]|uniref:hypothetical protein n=1 Tax=Parafrankia sp. EUN1f TaxID=102897 RepID=UPI0001C46D0A|nr:hypothetical protein [Parafrankia sp. EUN1f]EFC80185.1 hypothetical protein FrEUN1fDRAFT_6714 [Parafrankia sp. EUN1f]
MRPPGFLVLAEICHWLGHNPQRNHAATRMLLRRRGIEPAAQLTTGHRPLLWRWEDLQPLAARIPRADWAREAA